MELTQSELDEVIENARISDQSGEGEGAYKLGVLLQRRGQFFEAEAAFGRANERDYARGSAAFGALLEKRGLVEEAEAVYSRARDMGSSTGALRLGILL